MTAISANALMKIAAVVVYALLFLFSLAMVWTSLRANAHLAWSWRPDNLSYTFFPWMLFLGIALCAQALKPSFSWVLVAQCAVVGASLFFASANHALPERSVPLGSVHLLLVVLCCIWNIYAFRQRA